MKHNRRKRLPGMVALCILSTVLATLVMARAEGLTGAAEEKPADAAPHADVAAAGMAKTTTLAAEEDNFTADTETASDVTQEATPAPTAAGRYIGITVTGDELRELAAAVYLEARGESAEGQQAVAEVVLNRVLADNFPGTVHDVLYQPGQFTPADKIAETTPTDAQYEAVEAALSGDNILPVDVVYFSTSGENSRIWGTIGGHVFCRQYARE